MSFKAKASLFFMLLIFVLLMINIIYGKDTLLITLSLVLNLFTFMIVFIGEINKEG